ncbi:MAG: DnaJ C-terminal domain-containing protein, partial [Candidatus Phytoplasma australasiaticum]|nr:DnaJ C-terminal domain-containing protein [Candidatus Phytoplasma australasiaticum]
SEHKVTLNIPAGVESGMRLKSPNQGHQGPSGAPNGDLYVGVVFGKDISILEYLVTSSFKLISSK